MPPWQKLSLAQFLLRKLLGETGSKRFNILVILGKKSWLLLLLTTAFLRNRLPYLVSKEKTIEGVIINHWIPICLNIVPLSQ